LLGTSPGIPQHLFTEINWLNTLHATPYSK
jgi:hypothetical protein